MQPNHPDHPPIPGGYRGSFQKKLEWFPDSGCGTTWFTKTENQGIGFVGHVCKFSSNFHEFEAGKVYAGVRTEDFSYLSNGSYWAFRVEVDTFEEGAEMIQKWFWEKGLL